MATRLTKSVKREIVTPRGLTLIVTMTPEGLTFREKRRRKSYLLPYSVAFMKAVDLAVTAITADGRPKRVRRGLLRAI
jgi:hypothetical protein